MTTLKQKRLNFDSDVLEILQQAQWSADGLSVKLIGQLDRKTYLKVNKALDALGGKWNRGAAAHLFKYDPRSEFQALVENDGQMVLDDYEFWPTPPEVVATIIDLLPTCYISMLLEPSAGEGHIVDELVRRELVDRFNIHCMELHPDRAAILRRKGYMVIANDCLWRFGGAYSLIVQNPPFSNHRDIDHLLHHYHNNLAMGGRIISVMSEGAFFNQNNKCGAFRQLLRANGDSVQLPKNAFRESGTMVRARVVYLDK